MGGSFPSAAESPPHPAKPLPSSPRCGGQLSLPLPPGPTGGRYRWGGLPPPSRTEKKRYNAPAMTPQAHQAPPPNPPNLLPVPRPLLSPSWDRADCIILAAVTALALFLRIFRLEAMTRGPTPRRGHHRTRGLARPLRRLHRPLLRIRRRSGPRPRILDRPHLLDRRADPLHAAALDGPSWGAATVPAAYLLFRLSFGRPVALFAAVALAASHWHLYYSRSGFMLAAMPLVTTLSAAALLWALRSVRPGPVGPQARHEREGSSVHPGPVPKGPRLEKMVGGRGRARPGRLLLHRLRGVARRSSRPCSAATPSWSATGRGNGPPASRSSPSVSRRSPGRWRSSPSWTPMSFSRIGTSWLETGLGKNARVLGRSGRGRRSPCPSTTRRGTRAPASADSGRWDGRSVRSPTPASPSVIRRWRSPPHLLLAHRLRCGPGRAAPGTYPARASTGGRCSWSPSHSAWRASPPSPSAGGPPPSSLPSPGSAGERLG